MYKKLGGDRDGTALSNWSKIYSNPYDIMFSSKSWGKKEGKVGILGLRDSIFPSKLQVT